MIRRPHISAPRLTQPFWPFAINRASPQAVGLIACWPFRPAGGASLFDLAGSRIGAITGALWTAGYESENGLSFTGSTDIVSATNFTGLTGYTWAVWLEARSVPTTTVTQAVRNGHNSNLDAFAFSWSHPSATFRQAASHQDIANSYFAAKLTSTLAANTKYLICGSWDGTDKLKVYLNGRLEATTTGVGTLKTPTGNFDIGNSSDNSAFPGNIYEVRIYNRALADNVIREMFEPQTRFDLYAPLRGRIFIFSALNAYSLTADAGSFALSGQAAALQASRVIAAAQGSFALSGQVANLRAGKVLVANAGSFTLTGEDASLVVARRLTAAHGSFTLTGEAAALKAARSLQAGQGAFVLSGQAVTFSSGKTLTADAGSFALAGQAATLTKQARLAATTGSFSLSGQAVAFEVGQGAFEIQAEAGVFHLAGGDVAFIVRGRSFAPPSEVSLTPVAPSGVQSGLYDESLTPEAPGGVQSGKADVSLS